jgi:hypothetical protein
MEEGELATRGRIGEVDSARVGASTRYSTYFDGFIEKTVFMRIVLIFRGDRP